MVIDRTHRSWAIASAIVVLVSATIYVPYALRAPAGPTGGSALGLTFGIAAALLMFAAGFLGLRRRVPAWRVGRMQTWMRAHLWFSLLAVPLVLFHSGFSTGNATLTRFLMGLLFLVTVSGVGGALLQHFLPAEMTRTLPMETIYEQIDHIREQLIQECTDILAGVEKIVAPPAAAAATVAPGDRAAVAPSAAAAAQAEVSVAIMHDFYVGEILPLLHRSMSRRLLPDRVAAQNAFQALRMLTPPPLHDSVSAFEDIWEESRELNRQERYHAFLHGWLLVHVPLSYALLVLTAVHAVQALRY